MQEKVEKITNHIVHFLTIFGQKYPKTDTVEGGKKRRPQVNKEAMVVWTQTFYQYFHALSSMA